MSFTSKKYITTFCGYLAVFKHFNVSLLWLLAFFLPFFFFFKSPSTSLLFCHFDCFRSPPVHAPSIRVTLVPVVLVGLGSPLLHRNRRTRRRWSPEKLYQKPAQPEAQCRSCSSSSKYTYTVCLILSCSLLCLCQNRVRRLRISVFLCLVHYCPIL